MLLGVAKDNLEVVSKHVFIVWSDLLAF
jgi:hypothetical protein